MPRSCRRALLLLLPMLITLLPARGVTNAQQGEGLPLGDAPSQISRNAEVQCAGFISDDKVASEFKIVGGEKENEIYYYSPANIVYVDYGQKHGASVGESLSVVRYRGEYENPFTGKDLGHYHEEMGVVRIIAVQRDVSIAEVLEACDPIFVGDRVRPYDRFLSPTLREFQPLNRYDLPTGKLSGQIVLARNHRDYLGTNDVVYLDIGDDNGVKLGQYYTVYRKPGEEEGPVGGFNRVLRDDEDFEHRVEGFSDDRYRDGDFSVLRGRERPSKVIRERNGIPRKVVGEVCIIRVEKDSATAVVTRVAQEVNLGDYVELQ